MFIVSLLLTVICLSYKINPDLLYLLSNIIPTAVCWRQQFA